MSPPPGLLDFAAPQTARLVRAIGLTLCGLALGMTSINLWAGHGLRPAATVGVAAGALVAWLAHTGRLRAAAGLLCWGLVGVGMLAAFTTHGLFNPVWSLCAVGAMAGGWLFGRRMAMALAGTTTAGAVTLWLFERNGHDVPQVATIEMALGAVIVAAWLSAIISRWTAGSVLTERLRDAQLAQARLEAANAALQRSEGQLRTVLDGLPVGVLILDAEHHRPVYANGAMHAILGHVPEQVARMGPANVFPADRAEELTEHVHRAFRGELPIDRGVPLLRGDGSIVTTDIRSTPIMFDARPALLCTVTDVSEQRARETERERELELRRSIIDAIPGSFSIIDPDARRYLLWNRRLEEFTGLSRERLAEIDPFSLAAPEERPAIERAVRTVLESGSGSMEVTIGMPDGRRVPHLFKAYRLDWEGRPTMLNIGIDISDRKTAEAELERYRDHLEALVVQRTEQLVRARDAAEAAGQAKAAFVANLSHAVRTPMNAILGFTYLIRDRVRDPETRDHLEHLSASAQHLLEVINGILDLSRIDAGKMQLEPHAFSPDAMLDGVVSMLTPAARAKGLSLTIVKEALPGRLVGDEPRLTQVLNNLVDNAIKFTEHGGVTIRCDVQPAGEGQAIARFEVTDTGIGIPEALQRSLFSDSEQAGDPAGSGQAGSGLGLAITRRLVGMMGGQIGVSSRQDVGSTFWFTARLGLGEETSTTGPR